MCPKLGHILKAGVKMESAYTVSFFGHRMISNPLAAEKALEEIIRSLLASREYVEFLVGQDGEFDQLVASTILRCKRTVHSDNSSLVWVMLYETVNYRKNLDAYHAYYDAIEVAGEGSHYKAAFQSRKRAMVGRSDLVIFCLEKQQGGAWQTMEYAIRQGKSIYSISNSKKYFLPCRQEIAFHNILGYGFTPFSRRMC